MGKTTIKDQQKLMSVNQNQTDLVPIPRTNQSYSIGWIKPHTLEKISLLELDSGVESTSQETTRNIKKRAKLLSKAASYFILNGIKIFFFHWIFWRYLYYVKGYAVDQLSPIIEMAKKKSSASEIISNFNIGVSYENNESDTDSGGSRVIPSRTFIGVRSAFGEKHGWALKPVILFWGLIVIPEYIYRYKLSMAQIEIMSLDLPRVEYLKDSKSSKVKVKPKASKIYRADDPSIKLNEESVRKARERRKKQEWTQTKLSDLPINTHENTNYNG